MAGIVQNIISNSLSGFVSGAVTTIGGYAGDAVGGIGNMIERGGQQVGDGIRKTFRSYGDSINSYGTAARTATAPNAGGSYTSSSSSTEKKHIEAAPKKKALPAPSTGPGSGQKLLTAPPGMKGAAPSRPGVGSRKSSADKDNSTALVKVGGEGKAGGQGYTPYTGYKSPAPAAKKSTALTKGALKKVGSGAQGAGKKAGSVAGGAGGFAHIPLGGSAGVPRAGSTVSELKPYRPSEKPKTGGAGDGAGGGGTGGGKYQGLLNLGGIVSGAPSVAGSVKPSTPKPSGRSGLSKPSGGQDKGSWGAGGGGGKYQGPLNLSGIVSGAPSVAGSVKPSTPKPSTQSKPSGPQGSGSGKYQGPLNLGGIVSAAPSVAGRSEKSFKPGGGFKPHGGYEPGGGYSPPGAGGSGYKGPQSMGQQAGGGYKPATNPSNLRAKNVGGAGAKTPAPPRGPASVAGGGSGGGQQRSDGKVRISKESRPKK